MENPKYYCHYEEVYKPIRDFSVTYISSDPNTAKSPVNDVRINPRAICNKCIALDRSLKDKYDLSGKLKF